MADVAKPVLPGSKEEPKSFARRDRLRDIEKDVQASIEVITFDEDGQLQKTAPFSVQAIAPSGDHNAFEELCFD